MSILSRRQQRTVEGAVKWFAFVKMLLAIYRFVFLFFGGGCGTSMVEQDDWIGYIWEFDLIVHISCFILNKCRQPQDNRVVCPRLTAPTIGEKVMEAASSWIGLSLRILLHPRVDTFYENSYENFHASIRIKLSQEGRHLTRVMLNHPKLAMQRTMYFLRVVRWLKWIIPIIGAGNKLETNLKQYLRRRWQAHEHRVMKRFVKLMEHKVDEKQALERAVRHLQARFIRRRAENRALEALEKCSTPEEKRKLAKKKVDKVRIQCNVIRIQRCFRLWRKQRLDEGVRAHGFLMRPDTYFETLWMLVYLICVAIEVVKLLFLGTPKHSTYDLFSRLLLPDECLPKERQFFHGAKRKYVLAGKRAGLAPVPAYCEHNSRIAIVALFLHWFAALIDAFIFFVATIDVPIRFFTGVVNETTGKLEPQPWWPRWIAPGLAIQIIVNPGWNFLFEIINYFVECAQKSGPWGFIRCLVWIRPLILWIIPWIYHRVVTFVRHDQQHNKHSIFNSVKHEVAEGTISVHVRNLSSTLLHFLPEPKDSIPSFSISPVTPSLYNSASSISRRKPNNETNLAMVSRSSVLSPSEYYSSPPPPEGNCTSTRKRPLEISPTYTMGTYLKRRSSNRSKRISKKARVGEER